MPTEDIATVTLSKHIEAAVALRLSFDMDEVTRLLTPECVPPPSIAMHPRLGARLPSSGASPGRRRRPRTHPLDRRAQRPARRKSFCIAYGTKQESQETGPGFGCWILADADRRWGGR